MKKPLKTNIAQVFFVFTAFALLVAIGSFSIGGVLQKASSATVAVALNETEKTILAYLREPRIAFDNIYTAVQDLLDRGESQEAVERYLTQAAHMLLNQEGGINGFLSVYGFIRGEVIGSIEHKLDLIPQQRPWYQLAIRSENAEFTAPYVDAITGRTVISLAREIYGREGDYYGVLALDIDILWLMDYAESLQFAEGGYGMIVNQFLFTLAHPREEFRNRPLHELGSGYAHIADILRTHQNVSGEIIRDTSHSRAIVFFQELFNGWFVGVVMPVRSYYSDLYMSVLMLVGLGIILSSALSFILLRLSREKMRADEESRHKSSFLALISHEMRTPMNAIIGITQIQLQKENLPDEYSDALEKIYNSGNGMLGIINDLLDLSKIETGKLELNPTEYYIPSLINDAVQMNIIRIEKKPIHFILDLNEDLPTKLYGDELRLKQILNNLLSNAAKYTAKGHVKLSVSHWPEGEDVRLRIIVKDTGQGMKPEDRERLFSEYMRFNIETNRTAEGTGLGLNITKNLVELMDGAIEVESEHGRGSTFTVTVRQKPVECEPIGPELMERLKNFTFTRGARAAKLKIAREPMPYGKILIVDDVDINLFVAERLMEPYGLKIETVTSGFEAIKKVESGGAYDVIFMDHMMPLMDGIETTQKMRASGYKGVIIALTANALLGNAEMFKQNGFDDFLPKPINVRDLNSALNKYVRDRHSEAGPKNENN